MSQTPLAFMSYVNDDDKYANGKITKFREHLSRAVKAHRGKPFEIFQDKNDIKWGQKWQERINDALDATLFLIPIITPSFFNSKACREELERFLKREEELGRNDLILPVHYIECPVLKDNANDTLAEIIAAHQYTDWCDLRDDSFTTRKVRKALAKLAQQIVAALEQSEAEAARAEVVRKVDAAEKTPPPQQAKKGSKEPANSSNTFQSQGGQQNIAQGSNAIGTQINYGVSLETVAQLLKAQNRPQPTSKAEPPTVVVDQNGRGDYATITEAIRAVEAGTRILVRPGLYQERIVIIRPVEIIGVGNRSNIVVEASSPATVLFQANIGRLANLTLRQVGDEAWPCVNIAQGRLDLEDCDISACVLIHHNAKPRLRRNRIHDGRAEGVIIGDDSQGTLEDNEIFANAKHGIVIMDSGNITLSRNRISQNGELGILVFEGGSGILEDNDLRGNGMGAWAFAPGCEARVQRRGNLE